MSDYFRADNEYRFPTLEKFKRSVLQPMMYGMTEADCLDGIKTACEFFKIPLPGFIGDATELYGGQTMFVDWDPKSFDDDDIWYNLEQLKNLCVTSKEAFTLVMTHECGHRYLQNQRFKGFNDGRWEEELCCDFFMGVRAGLQNFSSHILEGIRIGLGSSEGSYTHPTGFLRNEVILYGYRLGRFDSTDTYKSSIRTYKEFYEEWSKKRVDIIRREQWKLFGLQIN